MEDVLLMLWDVLVLCILTLGLEESRKRLAFSGLVRRIECKVEYWRIEGAQENLLGRKLAVRC